MLNLTPEQELLVRCLRTDFNEENTQRLQSLAHMDLDWAQVVELASRQSVSPLLYQRLSSQFRAEVPEWVLQDLQNRFLSILARNVFLSRELARVSTKLGKAGLRCLAFKGPVLASCVFGDVEFRVFGDLDIMVPKESIVEVARLLYADGYRPLFPVPAKVEPHYLRFHYEHAFRRYDPEITIDIHWASTLPYLSFNFSFERLWERSLDTLVEGRQIRTLAPEDMLLILCQHGCKHGWKRMSWIGDVAGLVKVEPSLNLSEVLSTSEMIGSRRMVCLGLHLASDLLGIELPEAVLELINRDPKIKTLASLTYQHLFCRERPVAMGIGSAVNSFYIQTMLRKMDQMMCFVPGIFTPTSIELNLFPLPPSLFFLYILFKPLRLANKYFTIFLGHIRREGGCESCGKGLQP